MYLWVFWNNNFFHFQDFHVITQQFTMHDNDQISYQGVLVILSSQKNLRKETNQNIWWLELINYGLISCCCFAKVSVVKYNTRQFEKLVTENQIISCRWWHTHQKLYFPNSMEKGTTKQICLSKYLISVMKITIYIWWW